jgi:hypothetical protein
MAYMDDKDFSFLEPVPSEDFITQTFPTSQSEGSNQSI